MFVMGVLAFALGAPGGGIKVASPLEPELPNVFWFVGNPCIGFALAASNSTRHCNTFA
jgi:hypothetical protein